MIKFKNLIAFRTFLALYVKIKQQNVEKINSILYYVRNLIVNKFHFREITNVQLYFPSYFSNLYFLNNYR